MNIRKATQEDLSEILKIYEHARKFMALHGNPNQWGKTNPPVERVKQDIAEQKCHLCIQDKEIAGVFYFAQEEDSTYQKINGAWLSNRPYAVVHRIAVGANHSGVATYCLNWAYEQYHNIRIDTHEDNIPMQHLLKKLGFSYCGEITIADGSPRIAFQKEEKH